MPALDGAVMYHRHRRDRRGNDLAYGLPHCCVVHVSHHVEISSAQGPRPHRGTGRNDRLRHATRDLSLPYCVAVDVVKLRSDPNGMARRVDRHPEGDGFDEQSALQCDVRSTLRPRRTNATTPRRQRHSLFVARPTTAVSDAKRGTSNDPRVGGFNTRVVPVIGRDVLEHARDTVESKGAVRVGVTEADAELTAETSSLVGERYEFDHTGKLPWLTRSS